MYALGHVGTYYELPSSKRLKDKFFSDMNSYDMLESVKSPTMIIHGGMDEVVPTEHALKLYNYASDQKRLEIIECADHVFSKPEHVEKSINLTIEFFKKYL